MTQYDAEMPNVEVAFGPETLVNTFGEYISKHGMTQLRIAETQKYAHVTFFFNGGEEKTHFRHKVKCGNLRRSNKNSVLTLILLFFAAVEEESYVSIKARYDSASYCRNSKVCSRNFLLQRRGRETV